MNDNLNNSALSLTEGKLNDISTVFLLNQKNNARPYSFNVLKQMFINGSIITKAEYAGKCVGYVITEIVYDDAEIISIVVDNGFRKNGIGQKLLEFALIQAQKSGATRILLEVEETNMAALALYQKAGFKQISIRHKYYGDNSAFIMEYKFKS